MRHNVKDITLIGLFAAILVVQKIAFSFVPNFSLTIFLIILFSKKLGLVRTSAITFIFVLVDAIGFGTINPIYTPTTFIGYFFIPLVLCTIFKRTNNWVVLSFLSILFSFLYCWVYIIPNIFVYQINVIYYLKADVIYELIMGITTFVSVLLLYKPCSKIFDRYLIR